MWSIMWIGWQAPTTKPKTDSTAGEDEVDVPQDVFNALGVVFDAARMEKHGAFRLAPEASGFRDAFCGNAGDGFGGLERVLRDGFPGFLEIAGVLGDEGLVKRSYEAVYGPAFTPCQTLVDLGKAGGKFYK